MGEKMLSKMIAKLDEEKNWKERNDASIAV